MTHRARRFVSLLFVAILSSACGARRGTIGAVLAQDAENRLYVREVPEGLAADRADLENGDEILLIDGHDARALGARRVHELLSGDVGEPVKLTLVRGGRIVRVTLRRTPARKHRLPASEGGSGLRRPTKSEAGLGPR